MTQAPVISIWTAAPSDPPQGGQPFPLVPGTAVGSVSTQCLQPGRTIVVNSPSDLALEGWSNEGNVARAVIRTIEDPIRPQLEFMWHGATAGWFDPRYTPRSVLGASVMSSYDAMYVYACPLVRELGSTPQKNIYASALAKINARLSWLDYLSSLPSMRTQEHMSGGNQPSIEHQDIVRDFQSEWRVKRLGEIQANFGLSMQKLAEILQVSRPQLYKWLDVRKSISLQKKSIRRMETIERLAKTWRAVSAGPVSPWLEELTGKQSLLGLLTSDRLTVTKIERVFTRIAGHIPVASKSGSQRLRDAGYARRAPPRSLPSDE